LQQSLQSGQKYGGFNRFSPLNQSLNFDNNQSIATTTTAALNGVTLAGSNPSKQNSLNSFNLPISNSSHFCKNVSRKNSSSGRRHSNRDLLGLAERGKVGHSSSECSSNSSVEASVESNTGLLNHEKKGKSLENSNNLPNPGIYYQSLLQIVDKLVRY
jgi:hypothetical protein